MKTKMFCLLFVLLALILSACGSLPPPPGSATAAPTAQPTISAPTVQATGPVGLKYQYDAGCAAAAQAGLDPMGFPACILQRVQGGLLSPAEAIVAIQKLATAKGVPSYDGWKTLLVDEHAPMFVWCPGGDGTFIPDTARPLEDPRIDKRWWNTVGVVQAHPASDPAVIRTVTCPSVGWAVALH